MAYREKTAWLALVGLAVAFGPYFLLVAIDPPTAALPDLHAMMRFGIAAAGFALVLGTGHLALRFSAPDDARGRPDERDHAISRRALGIAYPLLIVGMIVVGCVMPFSTSGWELVNTAVFVVVLAEMTHYGVAVWCYRRGWHD